MLEPTIDLTNCDREPILIPGLIQPHGVMLVLKEPTLEIIQVSNNTSELLGQQTQELLGNYCQSCSLPSKLQGFGNAYPKILKV